VARGLSLRMDHGTQYLSDHFLKQVRFWGIEPSFAFVCEPETNGVAERFNRTLKEQAVFGKLGHRSPTQARREYFQAVAA
jgi:putative transposase